MTGCDKFNELISAAIDGEVTPDEEKELILHMEACSECRSLFSSLRVLSNEFSDMLIEPPDKLVTEIMDRLINRADKRDKRKYFTLFGRFAAAAVIVLVLFAADVFKPTGQNTAEMQYADAMAMADSGGEKEREAPESSLKYDEAYMSRGEETEEDSGLLGAGYGFEDIAADTEHKNDENLEGGGEHGSLGSAAPADSLAAGGSDPERSPEPTAAPAPQPSAVSSPAAVMYAASAKAREIWVINSYNSSSYYCVSIISGTIPEQLEDCALIAQNGGEMHYLVPWESIEELNEENRFSEIFYDDLDAEYGIVVVDIPMS